MRLINLFLISSALVAAGCLGGAQPTSSTGEPTPTASRQAATVTTGTAKWFTFTVNYQRAQGATGTKKVLLLHYSSQDSSEWDGVINTFGDGYDVVAADLLGHGKSSCTGLELSYHSQAEAMTALLDSLGWDKAHLVGIGAGGRVAAWMSLRTPERVASLTVMSADGLAPTVAAAMPNVPAPPHYPLGTPGTVNPLFRWDPCYLGCTTIAPGWPVHSTASAKAAWSLMLVKNNALVTDQFAQDMFKKEMARSCFYNWDEGSHRQGTNVVADIILTSVVMSPCGRYDGCITGPYSNTSQIKSPTLVLWGDQDKILEPAKWSAAWGTIPGSTVTMLPGCGHDLARDCPAEVSAAVKSFVDAH